jgi:hypothetical protein
MAVRRIAGLRGLRLYLGLLLLHVLDAVPGIDDLLESDHGGAHFRRSFRLGFKFCFGHFGVAAAARSFGDRPDENYEN